MCILILIVLQDRQSECLVFAHVVDSDKSGECMTIIRHRFIIYLLTYRLTGFGYWRLSADVKEINVYPSGVVGDWRKDEMQWMYKAPFGDKNGIQPQKLSIDYSSRNNVLFLHSCSFTDAPSPVWQIHGGMVLKRMYEEGELRRNLEEWLLNQCVLRGWLVFYSIVQLIDWLIELRSF